MFNSLDDLLSWLSAVLILAAAARGLRAAREINRIARLDPKSDILQTINYGTRVKVGAAIWFGTITSLAIVGIGPFPVLRPISLLIAVLVLDLPSRYLAMIRRIQGIPQKRWTFRRGRFRYE